MTFLKAFLADLAKLKRPVTAASVVALLIAIAAPFGIDLGPAGTPITGALVAIGTVFAYVESKRVRA